MVNWYKILDFKSNAKHIKYNSKNIFNMTSIIDPEKLAVNQDIIDIINNVSSKTLKDLMEKYRENKYMLNKISSYISNLPMYLDNDYNNYIRKQQHLDKIADLTKEFIDNYINSNNYFYCSSSELFFKYDGTNYFTYRDDTILYEIGSNINRHDFLVNYKHKVKNAIIKEIKDRNILDSIPDTTTIQLVVNNMLPLFLNNKIFVKYFLTVLGDMILKKNEQYTYLIDNNYKRFIKMISQLAYQYFGSNYFTNIKYGYHELQKNCRIIYADKYLLANKYNNTLENLISNLKCKNSNNFLDVFIVGVYYSNRYENADQFISSHDCETDIKNNIMLLDDINNIINRFILTTLEKANKDEIDNITISNRNMHYLWKQFLMDNNLPNINFTLNLKTVLRSQIEYNSDNDIYTGITSKKLPLISKFLEFWNETIVVNNEEQEIDTNLEVSEIVYLFKYWLNEKNSNSNISINENIVINLISHFFENLVIEEDKFIYNIHCKLWDKNNNIVDFINYFKKEFIDSNKIKRYPININIFYSNYCKWCKTIMLKFVVSKYYFNKFIISYMDGYIQDNNSSKILFIDYNYFYTI